MSAKLKPKKGRRPNDDYPTRPWCVDRLIDDVYLPAGRWLECAAGKGGIIETINTRIPGIVWNACEIQPKYREPLELLCEPGGVYTADFLSDDFQGLLTRLHDRPGERRRWLFDVVITNPPYSHAEAFVEAARKLAPVVVMLLPMHYLSSAERQPKHRLVLPEQGWILPDRPSFDPTEDGVGSAALEYAWFIWTPQSGPDCRMRVLGTTPLEVRRPRPPFHVENEIRKLLTRSTRGLVETEIIQRVEKAAEAPRAGEWDGNPAVHDELFRLVREGSLVWSDGPGGEDAPMRYELTAKGWIEEWRRGAKTFACSPGSFIGDVPLEGDLTAAEIVALINEQSTTHSAELMPSGAMKAIPHTISTQSRLTFGGEP